MASYGFLFVAGLLLAIGVTLLCKRFGGNYYWNAALVSLFAGWGVLCWLLPLQIEQDAAALPGWLVASQPFIGGMFRWLYLVGIGILFLIGSKIASGTDYNIDRYGRGTTADPVDQPGWSWLLFIAAIAAFAIGAIGIIFFEVPKLPIWPRANSLPRLIQYMQLADQRKSAKDREFNAITSPMFFTVPQRLVTKLSKDEWIAMADAEAKKEGDNDVKEITYLRFHSSNKRDIEYAAVGVKGKFKGMAGVEYEVLVFRNLFPDDEDRIAGLATVVLDEVPLPPEAVSGISGTGSSAGSTSPKVSIKLPQAGGVKKKI